MSPAMAAGVTDRRWSVEDLVALWEAYEQRKAVKSGMTLEQLYKNFCAFCGEQIGFADQAAAVRDENGKLMHWKCWNQRLEAKTDKDSK